MDQEQFDQITRTLASGNSRRGLVRTLTGAALGGILVAGGVSEAGAKKKNKKKQGGGRHDVTAQKGRQCKNGTPPCGTGKGKNFLCCASDKVCNGSSCVACGADTQSCCSGSRCNGDLGCNGGGTCEACGADGRLCCAGSVCNAGLGCDGGTCRPCPSYTTWEAGKCVLPCASNPCACNIDFVECFGDVNGAYTCATNYATGGYGDCNVNGCRDCDGCSCYSNSTGGYSCYRILNTGSHCDPS
jgi:hypothetical protein